MGYSIEMLSCRIDYDMFVHQYWYTNLRKESLFKCVLSTYWRYSYMSTILHKYTLAETLYKKSKCRKLTDLQDNILFPAS